MKIVLSLFRRGILALELLKQKNCRALPQDRKETDMEVEYLLLNENTDQVAAEISTN